MKPRNLPDNYFEELLDFCRDGWKTKVEIQVRFGISTHNAYYRTRQMIDLGLLEQVNISKTQKETYAYRTFLNAHYVKKENDLAGRGTKLKDARDNKANKILPGSRVISSDDYHTKGTQEKRSVWIGSSMALF